MELFVEYTGKTKNQFVAHINREAIPFYFVPAKDEWGTKFKTQIAKIEEERNYRMLIELEPQVRPYVMNPPARKAYNLAIKAEEKRKEEAKKREAIRKIKTAIKIAENEKRESIRQYDESVALAAYRKSEIPEKNEVIKGLKEELSELIGKKK